mgnify:CR=1 FL=1
MLFSSLTFLFCFLPAAVVGYYICPRKLRNFFLLLASIFFYAWGEPRYLPVIFATITISYFGALAVERFKYKKILLTLFILLDLSLLFYFKYTNFFLENLNMIFHQKWSLKVVLPLGISFYTFQALSYLVDVYRGQVKAQKNYLKIALYICLFPQLIAGPIVKYHDVADQIDNREETIDKVYYGIRRFIIGLAKKVLIANVVGKIADQIFALPINEFDAPIAWLGAISYTLQIYYDFSGYSDMAIGLGSIFGFKFLENFNYPYISQSITEFWRRWHMSLSTWFKDYVYIPLGGNRKGRIRTGINLIIVFFLTGFWHGASWIFILWGLWNGFFILLEKITGWAKKDAGILKKILYHVYTILAFIIGWVLFKSETVLKAKDFLSNMMGMTIGHQVYIKLPNYLTRFNMIILTVAILCAMPIFKDILNKRSLFVETIINVILATLFVMCISELAINTYNPFIYFRF